MKSRFRKYIEKVNMEEELTRLRKRLYVRCNVKDPDEAELFLTPVSDEWTCEAQLKISDEEFVPVGLVRISFVNSSMQLDDLVVYTPYRKLGLEKAIIKALRADALDAGAQVITWNFNIEDMPCREAQDAFLSRVGFRVGPANAVMALA